MSLVAWPRFPRRLNPVACKQLAMLEILQVLTGVESKLLPPVADYTKACPNFVLGGYLNRRANHVLICSQLQLLFLTLIFSLWVMISK